jgi:hypothetical protein
MKIITRVLILIILCSASLAFAEMRDPTLPPDPSLWKTSDQPLLLTAILISEQRRLAVIGGRFLQVGDNYSGNKVISIDSNSVQLEGVSGRITLFLVNNPIKTKSK